MRFNLSRQGVLRKKGEFDRVFKQGTFYRHFLVTLIICKNGRSYNRTGLITGKKLGNAVARNRIRRIFREAYRLMRPSLKMGFDVVMLPKPQSGELKRQDIDRVLGELFKRAELTKLTN